MNLKILLGLFCLVFLIPVNPLIAQKTRQGSTPRQDTMSVEADKKVNTQSDAGDIRAEAAYTVSKAADTNDGVCDADCSLREAIDMANVNVGFDVISFDPALTAAPVTISLSGTSLDISDDVTITGPGAERLTINAGGLSRIFTIGLGDTVEISGISLTGGYVENEGGAIYSQGNLTLMAVHIYGNTARFGGAILNWEINAVLSIYDSTIANNTALDVGAVASYGTLNLINSTVSGNTATGLVGALYVADLSGGTNTITLSTITGNSADSDGGIWSDIPNLEIGGSIIAGNTSRIGSKDFTGPSPVSLGYNLVGVVTNAGWFTATGDQKGSSATPLDPILAPLANNGGPIPTHAFDLSSGISPAIDAGHRFGFPFDTRGFQRTVDFPSIANATGGTGTDIGAYELQAPTAAPVTIAGRVLSSSGQPLNKAVVTLTGQDGSTLSTTTDPRGNFRFEGVDGGEGYVLSVSRKRYRFQSVFVNADADVAGLEIYAN